MKKLKTLTLKLPSGEKLTLKENKILNREYGFVGQFWYTYRGK